MGAKLILYSDRVTDKHLRKLGNIIQENNPDSVLSFEKRGRIINVSYPVISADRILVNMAMLREAGGVLSLSMIEHMAKSDPGNTTEYKNGELIIKQGKENN